MAVVRASVSDSVLDWLVVVERACVSDLLTSLRVVSSSRGSSLLVSVRAGLVGVVSFDATDPVVVAIVKIRDRCETTCEKRA